MKKSFYITTTLPYVNADPHVGFAAEILRADFLARYRRLVGDEVFFNTGTDEHGQKIYQKACDNNEEVQAYVDRYAQKFDDLKKILNLSYDTFIRTTDEKHIQAAQEFWKRCEANGDIYKKNYKVKYCVGCELEKTDSELENGRCPLHPKDEIQEIEEENYFFRFSKYQERLLELYKNNQDFVKPDFRLVEITKFVEGGLQDFSISRLKEKMPWGVSVPNDDKHVMYVWFDALVNYISTLNWPQDEENFEKWWPAIQTCGKDNLRQQSAMWQAMLMSAGLEPSKQIHVFGFINSGGQKMSKSLGNVINPLDIVNEYGTDALRYYVARHLSMYEDSDMTMDKFKELYNGNLANGLGNLVSRIMKMVENYEVNFKPENFDLNQNLEMVALMEKFKLNEAMDLIWNKIQYLDGKIQEEQPFKVAKENLSKAQEMIVDYLPVLWEIGNLLNSFMPETAQKIQEIIKSNKAPQEPLFLRKE
ncbi:MAG: methionine--tRNA ligase [Patescibacteria group bacterium]